MFVWIFSLTSIEYILENWTFHKPFKTLTDDFLENVKVGIPWGIFHAKPTVLEKQAFNSTASASIAQKKTFEKRSDWVRLCIISLA